MVPYDLYRLLQCPTCGSRDLIVTDAGVRCVSCRNDYPRHDGYLDLMPRAVEFDYVSKYVSEEEQLAEELDYRDLAPPLLAAGVRNRALVRMLDLRPGDIVLDNGCGTAKFAAWNAGKVRMMVGSDPATLFADAAVEQVALAKADSRKLPFADGSFDKGFSVDVLEHFPRDVIDGYLAEMARVLRPGGRAAVAVWGPRAENPWLGVLMDAVGEQFGIEIPPPGVRGPFSLAGDGELAAALEQGGFRDVGVERVETMLPVTSTEEWWSVVPHLGGMTAQLIAAQPDDVRAEIRARAVQRLAGAVTPRGVPGLALVARGSV